MSRRPPGYRLALFAVSGLLGLLAQLVVSGCQEAEIIDAPGERIDVHFAPEFELCAGTVPFFDRGIVALAEQLDLDPDTFEHFTYSWVDRATFDDSSPFYFDDQGGWAWGSKSYARHPLIFHEVVHMVVHQSKYNSITFLTEGIAVAYENRGLPCESSDEPTRVDPRPFLGAHYADIDYPIAGAFVTYLIARFGAARLLELNEELRFLSTDGKFRRRFARVYGLELDSVVDDYLNDETCPEDSTPPLPPDCAGDPLPWSDQGRWTYARVMSCGDEDVAGGVGGGFDHASVAVTLVVDQPGRYVLHLLSDHEVTATLTRCGGCPWLDAEPPLDASIDRGLTLEAGTYALTLNSRASEDIPLVVELRRD